MRYPVSGTATREVPPNTSAGATAITTLLSITSGRVFWCRGVSMKSTGTSGDIEIYDATAQTTATTQAIRLLFSSATAVAGNVEPRVLNFDAPGIKFSNSYVIAKLTASGSIGIGGMAIWGFEE